jgi:hypothetical protein
MTEYGKPFTAQGFGLWFRARCDEAGLPQCSAHVRTASLYERLAVLTAAGRLVKSDQGYRLTP